MSAFNTLENILTYYVKILDNGCWEWQGAFSGPYGKVTYHGKTYSAHVLIYTLIKGPIPARHDLHHGCLYKKCVNPDHLEPLTKSQHHLIEPSVRKDNKCWRGHEMTTENSYIDLKGYKLCRACRALAGKQANIKRRRMRLRLKLS